MQSAKSRSQIRANLGRLCLKQVMPLLVMAALAPLLIKGLADIDLHVAANALHDLSVWQWFAAVGLTGVSYWAIGRYDGAVHRLMNSRTDQHTARAAGIVSISLSQCMGFGIIVGTLARWRMLPDTSLSRALALTAVISLCFLAGWTVIIGITLMLFPATLPYGRVLGVLIVLAALGYGIVALYQPKLTVGKFRISVPNLPISLTLVGLAAIDLTAASLAFWCLLPAGSPIDFAMLMPAYLLAFTAGLVASTPAGLGPFEVTMLGLLPAAAAPQLVVAMVAFRIVYYLIPACIAAIALAAGPKTRTKQDHPEHFAPGTVLPSVLQAALAQGPRAELGLIHQGTHGVLQAARPRRGWLMHETDACLVGLTDPFGPEAVYGQSLKDLCATGENSGRVPVVYKCASRMAARARGLGFRVVKIAEEAVIDPDGIDLQTPVYRQLRRKLRQSMKAGIDIRAERGPLSNRQAVAFAAIDRAWQEAHGTARGFSMGRYDRTYVAWQRRYVAYHKGRVVAFATFHSIQEEWALDLMRHLPGIPDGTMHALIWAAIEDALALDCPRLTLAALPVAETTETDTLSRLARRMFNAASRADGLRQFKTCFAPKYQPLYMAAPTWSGLLIAVWDITRAIARPGTLPDRALPEDEITPHQAQQLEKRAA
ncbi:phosphatidylglycerol lysyltransferase domain-containing protein [Actibacterium sp. 188UL27-1]|uniref:phosphatidylglycerol lysyltransferase domain-containing protein n=1 Tax=Actibacterium sp. 188UL27-1 TaxID=2786961 RepID=UPI001957ACA7|nr:phosphatidylglycerol lysyltransferase domain-containing protein [Actibacterium sp. 188UL27-1]MBM7069703.1 DUF2156 domain-containing protein [Actibacterium sp. 188UL27-1]